MFQRQNMVYRKCMCLNCRPVPSSENGKRRNSSPVTADCSTTSPPPSASEYFYWCAKNLETGHKLLQDSTAQWWANAAQSNPLASRDLCSDICAWWQVALTLHNRRKRSGCHHWAATDRHRRTINNNARTSGYDAIRAHHQQSRHHHHHHHHHHCHHRYYY